MEKRFCFDHPFGGLLLKSFRGAFTLIEVLVSVMLIAVVVVGILKIREQNLSAARYIGDKLKSELENSLFLGKASLQSSGSKKTAYEMLRSMGLRKQRTIDLLKNTRREIRVSNPLPIGELPFPIQLRSVNLRGAYSATYYRLLYQ